MKTGGFSGSQLPMNAIRTNRVSPRRLNGNAVFFRKGGQLLADAPVRQRV